MGETAQAAELTRALAAAGVQAAIAAYTRALDTGRPDEIAELFRADGVAEIAGQGVFEGRDAIRAAYAGFAPTRPQLHLVGNTVLTSWSAREAAATSDVAFFSRGGSGWALRLVGRYDDVLRLDGGAWRFLRRTMTVLP
jgi:uncharacterized protein (TIGR02246 family)